MAIVTVGREQVQSDRFGYKHFDPDQGRFRSILLMEKCMILKLQIGYNTRSTTMSESSRFESWYVSNAEPTARNGYTFLDRALSVYENVLEYVVASITLSALH